MNPITSKDAIMHLLGRLGAGVEKVGKGVGMGSKSLATLAEKHPKSVGGATLGGGLAAYLASGDSDEDEEENDEDDEYLKLLRGR